MDKLNELIDQSEKLIIVKINADWCTACRTLRNHIMMVLPKWEDKVDFIEIDIEKNLEVMKKFEVNTIPTIIFIKDGFTLNTTSGVISSTVFEKILVKYLEL